MWDGQTVVVKGAKLELQLGAAGEKPKLVCKGVMMMITVRIVDQHGAKVAEEEKEEEVKPLDLPLLPSVPVQGSGTSK